MSRDSLLYLDDIVEACQKIHRYIQGVTQEELIQDSMRLDAIVRNLEIIGEAARRLPAHILQAIPGQPWTDIIGMRNILSHVYFGVDPDVVWSVAKTKVDSLEKEVSAYLEAHDEDAMDGPTDEGREAQ